MGKRDRTVIIDNFQNIWGKRKKNVGKSETLQGKIISFYSTNFIYMCDLYVKAI